MPQRRLRRLPFALFLAFLVAGGTLATTITTAPAQVLFDATKAEMAGNADWVIDADLHNLGVSGAGDGSGVAGGGSDSNPQRVPTPGIGGITASTPETYWNGALSAWAVALAQREQRTIETLPVFVSPGSNTRSRITFGDGSNAQDLSRYRMFVVCEPNILFTAAEKTAILGFVRAGGALFMVADHGGSDRNNDGADANDVWNDLFTNNAVQANPFGFSFNADSVSPANESADAAAANPLTHGPAGTVTRLQFSSGTTMTINNANVARGAVWTTSAHANSQVMALYGTFGAGRFAAIGDSSPIDDGTGDSGDTLFDGWDDAGGDDGQLVMNASAWLLNVEPRILSVTRAPNPTTGVTDVTLTFATETGRRYRVERAASLSAGTTWTPIGAAAVAGTGQTVSATDAGGGGSAAAFYRVRVTTP